MNSTPSPTANAADTQRAELLAQLTLPETTTNKELTVILHANVGALLPFKAAVFQTLLRHVMRDQSKDQAQARDYLKSKFPSIKENSAPLSVEAAADFLRKDLIKIYSLPDEATDEEITRAARTEKDANISLLARRAQEAADESLISEKIKAGLTRDQAVAVIRRQRDQDELIRTGKI